MWLTRHILWKWPQPTSGKPLHVLVPGHSCNLRVSNIKTHASLADLAPNSILWLDDKASLVCPELLYLQLAQAMPLPQLVLLGYELCGNFSRNAEDPLEGPVVTHVPTATSVDALRDYLSQFKRVHGLLRAREALNYVSDLALSAPEAVLGTMYSLPPEEAGYGMGPVTLNGRVDIVGESDERAARTRFPDLLFSFAKLGVNYDGGEHLDLSGLVGASRLIERGETDERGNAREELADKLASIRAKVVDDNRRNLQLASRGYIVFPITKEDVYGYGHLDTFTRRLLACASNVFGVNVTEYEKTLDDTYMTRDRNRLLASLLPSGRPWGASYGRI
jgi:hypothetical protein